jgi:hypothetical protein
MKVQVKAIRQRGIRLSDYDISALKPIEGVVTVYGLGPSIQLSVFDPNNQQQIPLLPSLYDARLVTMQGDKMLFAGIQRTADPREAQYLQEWSVLILPIIVDAEGLPVPDKP